MYQSQFPLLSCTDLQWTDISQFWSFVRCNHLFSSIQSLDHLGHVFLFVWLLFFWGWGHEGQSIQQASSSSLFLRRPSWVVLAWAGTSILCHCPSVTICGRGKNYGKLMVTQWKVVEKMCMMYIMYCDGRNKLCAHEMSFAVAVMGRLAQWNSWNKILVTDHPSFRTTLSSPSPSKFHGNYPWPRTIPFLGPPFLEF